MCDTMFGFVGLATAATATANKVNDIVQQAEHKFDVCFSSGDTLYLAYLHHAFAVASERDKMVAAAFDQPTVLVKETANVRANVKAWMISMFKLM